MMWKLFPGHDNLLPAFFTSEEAYLHDPNGSFAKKPVFGREGCNITLIDADRTTVIENSTGSYDEDECVYQELCRPPKFDNGSYAVVGGWMIGDEPAGLCVREEETIITKNTSRFVPHIYI
jgi:glutathionylspermidine synthase